MNTETRRNLSSYIDDEVVDQHDHKLGKLNCLWTDGRGEPAYLGVQTGWVFGKTHVVPADRAEVNEVAHVIRLPFTEEQIKEAPCYDPAAEIDSSTEQEVRSWYGVAERPESPPPQLTQRGLACETKQQPGRQAQEMPSAGVPTERGAQAEGKEEATIELREEQLKVGKRQVETGSVRLRKVVRTETINQPVDLQREEIVVERIPAGEEDKTRQAEGEDFQEQDIFIPLRREEPVIQKESRVKEKVRVSKKKQTERQDVSEQIRKEDVEIERPSERPPQGMGTPPQDEDMSSGKTGTCGQ